MLVSLIVHYIRPQWVFAILLLPGFFFLGAARYQMAQPPAVLTSNLIAYYNDAPQRMYVTGILTEPPDVRDTYMNLRIDVRKVDTGEGDREGVFVLMRSSRTWKISLTGTMTAWLDVNDRQ